MRADPLAIAPIIAALTATTYAGTQISSATGMLTWLIIGACAGACTAICIPIGDDDDRKPHAVKKKFAFSLLCGVGITFCFYVYRADLAPTADSVFAVSWLAGTLAWISVPVVMPIIRAAIRRWGTPK